MLLSSTAADLFSTLKNSRAPLKFINEHASLIICCVVAGERLDVGELEGTMVKSGKGNCRSYIKQTGDGFIGRITHNSIMSESSRERASRLTIDHSFICITYVCFCVGKNNFGINVHNLSHLAKYVDMHGSMSKNSLFLFERDSLSLSTVPYQKTASCQE